MILIYFAYSAYFFLFFYSAAKKKTIILFDLYIIINYNMYLHLQVLKTYNYFYKTFIPAFENTPSAERVRSGQAVVATGMLFAILHGKNVHQALTHHIQVFPPRLNFIWQHFHLNNGVNWHLTFPITTR